MTGTATLSVLITFICALCCAQAEAVEFEIGPTLLSAEYSEGAAAILSDRIGKFVVGGGYVAEQYCHCSFPAKVEPNIFFHAQRVFEYKALEAGVGPAYFQNTNRALGKSLTWSISFGFKGEKWAIRIRHFSNAGSGKPNLGQDFLTVGYSF